MSESTRDEYIRKYGYEAVSRANDTTYRQRRSIFTPIDMALACFAAWAIGYVMAAASH